MVALGGNSLFPWGSLGAVGEQFSFTRMIMERLSEFILKDYNLCITHGNGPQVGNELLRMDLTNDVLPPLPLGICAANNHGQVGCVVQQTLQNKLRNLGVDREVMTLVKQVIADKMIKA